MSVESYQGIIQTAIEREIAARDLYADLAKRVTSGAARELLEDLSSQEEGHRRRLVTLLEKGFTPELLQRQNKRVADLKITDFLQEPVLDETADVQQVLIVAGKRETGSYDLYAALGSIAEDEGTMALFRFLADQELQHKHRVESLYEELFYAEF